MQRVTGQSRLLISAGKMSKATSSLAFSILIGTYFKFPAPILAISSGPEPTPWHQFEYQVENLGEEIKRTYMLKETEPKSFLMCPKNYAIGDISYRLTKPREESTRAHLHIDSSSLFLLVFLVCGAFCWLLIR